MNVEFDAKAIEFDKIREQLVINYEFLQRFYVDMQRKLNEKNDMIVQEREIWEREKQEIRDMVKMDSEVLALNVGGTHHMMTERDVLRLVPGSTLEKMFSGMHELKKIDEEVFLDRDGQTFQHLVNYLRNDREVFPEFMDRNDEIHFFKELDFWRIPTKYPRGQGLTQPPRRTNSGVRSSSFTRQERHVPMPQPQMTESDASAGDHETQGVALKAAKDKWNELGPLRLDDIVANSSVPIDQSIKFGQSKYNKYIIGQLASNGKVTGVGKEINHIIYEGQFVDDVYNGFGRFIYSNGNYYIGNWLDGKRSGYGKLVDKSGKVYEG